MVGPQRVWCQTQKKWGPKKWGPKLWGPEGYGPEGWRPEGVGLVGPPGFHTTTREPKRAHLRVPVFKNKIQRKDPQEREERKKIVDNTQQHTRQHQCCFLSEFCLLFYPACLFILSRMFVFFVPFVVFFVPLPCHWFYKFWELFSVFRHEILSDFNLHQYKSLSLDLVVEAFHSFFVLLQ